jgi:hypothetical protein
MSGEPPRAIMNPLPPYIYNHPDGLLVRIRRHGVLCQVFLRWATPDALARAIQLRDRFLALANNATPRVLSNTGIRGISETVRWYHSKPYEAFAVRWAEGPPPNNRGSRVFTYRACGGREQALRAAVALRARMTGETITDAQIERALNV